MFVHRNLICSNTWSHNRYLRLRRLWRLLKVVRSVVGLLRYYLWKLCFGLTVHFVLIETIIIIICKIYNFIQNINFIHKPILLLFGWMSLRSSHLECCQSCTHNAAYILGFQNIFKSLFFDVIIPRKQILTLFWLT